MSSTGHTRSHTGTIHHQRTRGHHSTPCERLASFYMLSTLRLSHHIRRGKLARTWTTAQNDKLETDKLQAEVDIKSAKARVAELQLAELEGTMHRAEDVEAITTDLVFNIRSMLMAMPGRLAVDTAELASPAETSARIQEEVNEILLSLSQYHYDPEEYKKRVKDRQGWAMIEDDEQAE